MSTPEDPRSLARPNPLQSAAAEEEAPETAVRPDETPQAEAPRRPVLTVEERTQIWAERAKARAAKAGAGREGSQPTLPQEGTPSAETPRRAVASAEERAQILAERTKARALAPA